MMESCTHSSLRIYSSSSSSDHSQFDQGEIMGEVDEVEYIKTSKLHLTTSEELAVNIDGDEGILLPFQANVLYKHLRLFVPGTK